MTSEELVAQFDAEAWRELEEAAWMLYRALYVGSHEGVPDLLEFKRVLKERGDRTINALSRFMGQVWAAQFVRE